MVFHVMFNIGFLARNPVRFTGIHVVDLDVIV